jgi:adapter protein MecA 1/2
MSRQGAKSMRLERLTANKIKIFLTSDDLFERGLSKEDIWKDSIKWHQLFHDMLQEASEELNFDFRGAVAVEIFSIQAQGMIMIITVDDAAAEGDEVLYDGFLEMQVQVEGSDILLYQFNSIDDVIELSKRFISMRINGGSLYAFNNQYYLLMKNIDTADIEKAASVLSEYGNISIISPYVLDEYGKKVIENNAVNTLFHYFK